MVRFKRMAKMPVARGALALMLVGVAVSGAVAAHLESGSCRGSRCAVQVVRWSRPLAGAWVAQSGYGGTVFAPGEAHASAGGKVAAIGYGLTLSAYDVTSGFPRWTQSLTGFPAGSAIVAVHAWQGVITVGVGLGNGAGSGTGAGSVVGSGSGSGSGAGTGFSGRQELVFDAMTGKRIRSFSAGVTGGAVYATKWRTVVIGRTSVTGYSNATGHALWRDQTGAPGQDWRVSAKRLYITISSQGAAGTAPVTGVREISLASGAERLITPPFGSFDGKLAAVVGGSLVFSGDTGLSMYSTSTGQLTGGRTNAEADSTDPVKGVLYAEVGGALTALNPVTGRDEPGAAALPARAYAVRDGLAIGVGQGSGASVWVYSIARHRVLWTAKGLPWPHYFADTSGLPGSVDPSSQMVLITACAKTGTAVAGTVVSGSGRACLHPELVAVGPWGSRA